MPISITMPIALGYIGYQLRTDLYEYYDLVSLDVSECSFVSAR